MPVEQLLAVSVPDQQDTIQAVDWQVFVCQTRTGTVVEDNLPWVGRPRWDYGLNTPGSLQVTLPIGPVDKTALRQLIGDSWRYSIGLAHGQQIIQCGPLITYRYGDNEGPPTVEVGCSGLWGLLSGKRMLLNAGWDGANPALDTADLNLGPTSLHTIAKQLVSQPLTRAGCDLPIVFPADIAGTATRTYPGYDLAYIGERLAQLTQVEDGPEVEFRPEFTTPARTQVQWRMRIGEPAAGGRLGQLAYPHVWDYGKSLMFLDEDLDGSKQTSLRIERGNGTERQLLTGIFADPTLTNAGWPHLEDAGGSHTSAIDVTTLGSWARAAVNTYRGPTILWSATVRVAGDDGQGRLTGSPQVEMISAGDNGILNTSGHRFIPDGEQPVRILGVTSDTLTTAHLILQPIQGA